MKTILFQNRFVESINLGIKSQTIRKERKRPIIEGDQLSLRFWSGKPYRSAQREIVKVVVTEVQKIDCSRKSKMKNKITKSQQELYSAMLEGCQVFYLPPFRLNRGGGYYYRTDNGKKCTKHAEALKKAGMVERCEGKGYGHKLKVAKRNEN